MATAPSNQQSTNGTPTTTPVIAVVIAWLWAGLPLAWGVFETFKKTLELFK